MHKQRQRRKKKSSNRVTNAFSLLIFALGVQVPWKLVRSRTKPLFIAYFCLAMNSCPKLTSLSHFGGGCWAGSIALDESFVVCRLSQPILRAHAATQPLNILRAARACTQMLSIHVQAHLLHAVFMPADVNHVQAHLYIPSHHCWPPIRSIPTCPPCRYRSQWSYPCFGPGSSSTTPSAAALWKQRRKNKKYPRAGAIQVVKSHE